MRNFIRASCRQYQQERQRRVGTTDEDARNEMWEKENKKGGQTVEQTRKQRR
jgi:hypothetical protein